MAERRLSIVFLCALGISVARWLDPLAIANLLLLISLGILLVRAAYFQPEPLYYILFFLAGLLAWKILRVERRFGFTRCSDCSAGWRPFQSRRWPRFS